MKITCFTHFLVQLVEVIPLDVFLGLEPLLVIYYFIVQF